MHMTITMLIGKLLYICTCVLYNNIIEGYNFQIYCNATACEDACIRVLHTYYTIDTYIYT